MPERAAGSRRRAAVMSSLMRAKGVIALVNQNLARDRVDVTPASYGALQRTALTPM
jgi:hypothetical protein